MKRVLWVAAVLVCGCGSRSDRKPDASYAMPPHPDLPESTPDRPNIQKPVLPEADVHPDYPTPRRAGTDELFLLEEPSRGPHVTSVTPIDRGELDFQLHAYCEIDHVTVVCGPRPPAKNEPGVRVGSKDGRPVIAEWLRQGRVDRTVVLSYDAGGAIVQMAVTNGFGDVEYVRSYAPAGREYTARALTGANALAGCGSMELELDDKDGRVRSARCLQWSGDTMRDTNGVSNTRYERDQDGFVVREEHYSNVQTPVDGRRDGVHRIITTRDAWGRPTELRFQDLHDQPVANNDWGGCFGIDHRYVKNRESERTCLGDKLAPAPDDRSVTIRRFEYDKSGCVAVTRFLDAAGTPASDDGVVVVKQTNEAHCIDLVYSCFDSNGRGIACDVGEPAEYRDVIDEHGRTTSQTYRDAYGGATTDGDYHVAQVNTEWDDLGRVVGIFCRDFDGANVDCDGTGYHHEIRTVDDAGRTTESRFEDPYGRPTTNLGAWRRQSSYDNYDHLSEDRNLDDKGNLTLVEGAAIERFYYDDSHRLFGMVLLDPDKKPARYGSCFVGVTCPNEPWQAMRIIRGATGRVEQNEYFDETGKLLLTVDCRAQPCWQ